MQYAKLKNNRLEAIYDSKQAIRIHGSNGQEARMTGETLAAHGVYEYRPIPLADGERLDDVSYELLSGVVWQRGTIISAEQVKAEQIAEDIAAHGEDIAKLASLLAAFNLTMPITLEEATPIIYAASKQDPTLTPDGVVLQNVYADLLHAGLDDDRIFEAWQQMNT